MHRSTLSRINARLLSALALSTGLVGCQREPAMPELLGTLEADRIEILAESAERITEVLVSEGDSVAAGTLLLKLDVDKLNARLAAEQAELRRLKALADELAAGPRQEDRAEAKARVDAARARVVLAEDELLRAESMSQRKLISANELDRARRSAEALRAEWAATRAVASRLAAGTRIEQIEQNAAAIEAQQARIALTELELARNAPRAPRAGLVESLPLKLGDRARIGDALVVLIARDSAYARVFAPAHLRERLRLGDRLSIEIHGQIKPVPGHIRRISAEASFTPYFALHGDDAERLSYVVEVALSVEPEDLPLGVPVRIVLPETAESP